MKKIFVIMAIIILLASCNKDAGIEVVSFKPELKPSPGDYIIPVVDPDNMRIPFPNDLLIDQTTGKINIPVTSEDSQMETVLKWQLNTLNGFSTSTTIYVDFTYPIAISTITANDVLILNTRKFQLSLVPQSGVSVTDAIVPFRPEFFYLNGKNRLVLHPEEVLEPGTTYVVLLKRGIKGVNGVDVSPSPFYLFLKNENPLYDSATSSSTVPALSDDEAKLLEQLREKLQDLFLGLDKTGLATKDDILMLWSFTTVSVGNTLKEIISDIITDSENNPENYVARFDDFSTLVTSVVPAICVYAPSTAPQICGNVPDNPTLKAIYDNLNAMGYGLQVSWVIEGYFYTRNYRALLGYFTDDLSWLPEKLHFLLTLPAGGGPFPVVIYQHGITRNKKDIFLVANGFAMGGLAVAAIDLPDHGERVEGEVDLNGDGTPDGDHFIDPQNLLTTRDRMRQAVIDLVIFSKVLKNWDRITDTFNFGGHFIPVNDFASPSPSEGWVKPDGVADLSDRLYFVGHSLGGIIGGVFMAMSPDVKVGVLNSAGGEVARIIGNSLAFSPSLMKVMGDVLGYTPGTYEFSQFWYDFVNAAQWLVDQADPVNYARMWNEEPVYNTDGHFYQPGSDEIPMKKKVLMVGSRFDPVVPDVYRDVLAETGGLYSNYTDYLTTTTLVDDGGYILWNSYSTYDIGDQMCQRVWPEFQLVNLLPYYLDYGNGATSISIGSHVLMLTPAKIYCDLSVASTSPDSVWYLPHYLEMYTEIDSFLASDGALVKVEDKASYLPSQSVCANFEQNQSLCSDPNYQLACYLCSYWGKDIVYKPSAPLGYFIILDKGW